MVWKPQGQEGLKTYDTVLVAGQRLHSTLPCFALWTDERKRRKSETPSPKCRSSVTNKSVVQNLTSFLWLVIFDCTTVTFVAKLINARMSCGGGPAAQVHKIGFFKPQKSKSNKSSRRGGVVEARVRQRRTRGLVGSKEVCCLKRGRSLEVEFGFELIEKK